MKRLLIQTMSCIILALSFSANAVDPFKMPARWEGSITFIHTRTPSNGQESGTVTTTWTLKPKWKEIDRIDVQNNKGEVTGQFVLLSDNGSSWNVKTEGNTLQILGCNKTEKFYSMESAGSKTLQTGWVYYSLSDNDPLKDVLPNGTYSIVSDFGQQPQGSIRVVATSCSGSVNEYTIADIPVMGFRLSRPSFIPIAGQGPISAEAIKPYVAGIVMTQGDKELRVLNDDKKMKGDYKASGLIGNHIQESITWDLDRKLVIEGKIFSADKKWRPTDSGSPVIIRAALDDAFGMQGKFRFTLFEVSHEKGVAMNKGDEVTKDLLFIKGTSGFGEREETADGYRIESMEVVSSSEIAVYSKDYGAWGKIKAEVNVDGEWYDCVSEDGKSYVTIPFDQDEDFIADSWEESKGVLAQSTLSDDDTEPVGREPGDGFSNYEEYRGFFVDGEWTDTDPKAKDLFIHNPHALDLHGFEASHLILHAAINETEYDEDRVVNFNRSSHTSNGEQKGIYIHTGSLADFTVDGGIFVGMTIPNVGSPNTITEIIIDGGGPDTIAHELGHAVNLMHHGQNFEFATCGESSTAIAISGGITSGDVNCFMRYDASFASHYKKDGICQLYPSEDSNRHLFCSSTQATGINAPPLSVAGPAVEFGDCQQHITLKGYRTWGE